MKFHFIQVRVAVEYRMREDTATPYTRNHERGSDQIENEREELEHGNFAVGQVLFAFGAFLPGDPLKGEMPFD